ncbi:MAG: F0F1 ATP synthase subunit A [Candidatus Limnocylindrales bacterium]
MTDATAPVPGAAAEPGTRRGLSRNRKLGIAILAIVVLDIVAGILLAPAGFPGPKEGINGNLELIAPTVVYDFAPRASEPTGSLVVDFHPSITNTILVSWIVMLVMIVVFVGIAQNLRRLPGSFQNAIEYVYEALEDFAMALGGPAARPYVGIFAALFLFIALANWTDMLIFGDKVNWLRTPTSDINITVGLALFSFLLFHFEGVRRLGVRRYLGKFFNFTGFKRGPVDGLIDLFVGLIEFLLEFFKPVTLAFRLFGNLYGGGIMLGVFTALLLGVLPLPFVALEGFIGFVQALIFSVLTLMFTLIAIESHDDEAHAESVSATPHGGSEGSPVSAVAH